MSTTKTTWYVPDVPDVPDGRHVPDGRLPFSFSDASIQKGRAPNRQVLVLNTNGEMVWTTEELLGKDMWLEWEAHQKEKKNGIYVRGNGTTESRAAARQFQSMLRQMNDTDREQFLQQMRASSSLDEVEDVD